MMLRMLIVLCLLLAAPLAGAAMPAAHDHHMHPAQALPATQAAPAGLPAAADPIATRSTAPDCHLSASGNSPGDCGHTFTHACCAPAALVHVAALADLRPAARGAQHGIWLRLSLAPRVQRIFHPPRHLS